MLFLIVLYFHIKTCANLKITSVKCKNSYLQFSYLTSDFGSIMNMATASGRNLFLDNFAREISSCFNLPLLPSLVQKFIPEMVLEEVKEKNEEYIGRVKNIMSGI